MGKKCGNNLKVFSKRAEIPKTEITPSEFNYGFMIKDHRVRIKSGIDQRDVAIIAGAKELLHLLLNKVIYTCSTSRSSI